MAERYIFLLVVHINQHGMTMIERASAAVLPGKEDGNALHQKRPERQRLRHAVVQRHLSVPHFLTLLQQFFDLGMNREITRITCKPLCKLLQLFSCNSSWDFIIRTVTAARVIVPVE